MLPPKTDAPVPAKEKPSVFLPNVKSLVPELMEPKVGKSLDAERSIPADSDFAAAPPKIEEPAAGLLPPKIPLPLDGVAWPKMDPVLGEEVVVPKPPNTLPDVLPPKVVDESLLGVPNMDGEADEHGSRNSY